MVKPQVGNKEKAVIDMTRLEILTLLYSLQALLESNNSEKAKEVIEKVIKEAESIKRTVNNQDQI